MSAPFNERGGESLGGVGGGETPLPGFRGGALGGFEWLRRRFARSFTQVEWELISRGGESIDEVGGRGAGRGGGTLQRLRGSWRFVASGALRRPSSRRAATDSPTSYGASSFSPYLLLPLPPH